MDQKGYAPCPPQKKLLERKEKIKEKNLKKPTK